MAIKNTKNKKQTKPIEASKRQKAAQIFLAIFAVILILSMILSATTTNF